MSNTARPAEQDFVRAQAPVPAIPNIQQLSSELKAPTRARPYIFGLFATVFASSTYMFGIVRHRGSFGQSSARSGACGSAFHSERRRSAHRARRRLTDRNGVAMDTAWGTAISPPGDM